VFDVFIYSSTLHRSDKCRACSFEDLSDKHELEFLLKMLESKKSYLKGNHKGKSYFSVVSNFSFSAVVSDVLTGVWKIESQEIESQEIESQEI